MSIAVFPAYYGAAMPMITPNPIRGSQTATGSSASTLTTPSLSYTGNDLLVGVGFNNNASNQFSTATWSNGKTNISVGTSPNSSPSAWINYVVDASNGSTTFNFTTSGIETSLVAVLVDLIAANPVVAPTLNATSVASGSISGTGPVPITLGSYTTIKNDCVIAAFCGSTGTTLRPTGTGATWGTINVTQGSLLTQVAVGYGCAASMTQMALGQSASGTVRYAVCVFSGVQN